MKFHWFRAGRFVFCAETGAQFEVNPKGDGDWEIHYLCKVGLILIGKGKGDWELAIHRIALEVEARELKFP